MTLGKHTISGMMFTGAIAFYAIFGIIVLEVFYGSPEVATKPVEHAAARLGQILSRISPFIAGILGLFAGARYLKERKD